MSDSIDTVAAIASRAMATVTVGLRDHIDRGAGTNATIASNRAGWDGLSLRPRVLAGEGRANPATELLGLELSMPVLLAPVGPLELLDPGGAVAAAHAAHQAGIVPVIAITSSPSFSQVAEASNGPLFAQIYWWGDRSWMRGTLDVITDAGYAGVVVTVDAPAYSVREHDVAAGYSHHDRMALPNLAGAPGTARERLAYQAGATWADIEWLAGSIDLPVAVKGITRVGDASRAVDAGAAAVYVSNHGGRVLDHMPAVSDALGGIADAVDVPVIVDGGIDSANDVAKAVALGATAAALGRLQCWGLADPEGGLTGLLAALQREITDTMTILGTGSPHALGRWALGR